MDHLRFKGRTSFTGTTTRRIISPKTSDGGLPQRTCMTLCGTVGTGTRIRVRPTVSEGMSYLLTGGVESVMLKLSSGESPRGCLSGALDTEH